MSRSGLGLQTNSDIGLLCFSLCFIFDSFLFLSPPHGGMKVKVCLLHRLIISGTCQCLSVPPDIVQIWAPIMSHLGYLTSFLTGLHANSFPHVQSFPQGHVNYKCDHVTPLWKTILCILMTTRSTQNKLYSPENWGHISPFQIHSLAGLPQPQSYRSSALTQTLLILPWTPCLEHSSLTTPSTSAFASFPSTSDFSFTTGHNFSYLSRACVPV